MSRPAPAKSRSKRPAAQPSKASREEPFWRRKRLGEMSKTEWESLCDGCGKCCLLKLEDEDTGEVSYTDAACKLLDMETCQCTHYLNRKRYVPDCIKLTPKLVDRLRWMPSTCAYRLLSEGKDLPEWHPLISGDPESVHRAGVSVRGRAVPEAEAGELENRIVEWPE
jgi:uncharacterized cysteine cluster protein YcgN (CxxCxxCC family)